MLAYGFAYFNAYDFVSGYPDPDFVIHLCDYLYNHDRGQLAPQVHGRQGFRHIPYTESLLSRDRVTAHFDFPAMAGEISSFEDYVTRYMSYRADPGMQALPAAALWIAI